MPQVAAVTEKAMVASPSKFHVLWNIAQNSRLWNLVGKILPIGNESSDDVKYSHKNGWVRCDVNLTGKTVLITGANTGIGFTTAQDVAKRGAKVILACRNLEKAEESKSKILSKFPDSKLVVQKLDLASLSSVHDFARNINLTEDRLDILINNAGVMVCPQSKTEDGFEMHIGVNHIGHFLLTNLLLDLIKKSAPSRIVVVSSVGYKRGVMKWSDLMHDNDNYVAWNVYFQSKLANVLFMQVLCEKLQGTGVTCNSLHPGLVKTELGRHMRDSPSFWRRLQYKIATPFIHLLFKSPEFGAQTSIYCAIAPELETVTGKYFSDCREEELLSKARNMEDARRLWKLSEEWAGLTHAEGGAGEKLPSADQRAV